jgi:LEA14-like dessication related protein
MAVSYNTVIDQGATWYLTVTYENPNGTPINITGYTAALQLRSLPSDAVAVLSLTTGSGITITGATGTVAITATATQTRAIDEGTYYYDLEITSTLGVVTRLVQGQVVVSPEVTR